MKTKLTPDDFEKLYYAFHKMYFNFSVRHRMKKPTMKMSMFILYMLNKHQIKYTF